MARINSYDKYQGLFQPDITEYSVQRDSGSDYKTFADYDEAKAYFNYLQQLDNQDKIVKSQAQMANELKRQNDIAEKRQNTHPPMPLPRIPRPDLDPEYREWLQFKKETDPEYKKWKRQKQLEEARVRAEQERKRQEAERKWEQERIERERIEAEKRKRQEEEERRMAPIRAEQARREEQERKRREEQARREREEQEQRERTRKALGWFFGIIAVVGVIAAIIIFRKYIIAAIVVIIILSVLFSN